MFLIFIAVLRVLVRDIKSVSCGIINVVTLRLTSQKTMITFCITKHFDNFSFSIRNFIISF